MKLLYFIFADNGWKQVTYDEYASWDGEKDIRPPHWGLIQLQSILESTDTDGMQSSHKTRK